MPLALALIFAATGYRLLAAFHPGLVNFSPLMAMTFCAAVYFQNRTLWLAPLAALSLSDLYLDHYYAAGAGYTWDARGAIIRSACFVVALGIGAIVARRRNWLNLFSGALGGAVFFYLATNSYSWFVDAFYAKTPSGWWQAMTVGHPEFAPTLVFFRNTMISDLLFTGVFALAMEAVALRKGQPTLLTQPTVTAGS